MVRIRLLLTTNDNFHSVSGAVIETNIGRVIRPERGLIDGRKTQREANL